MKTKDISNLWVYRMIHYQNLEYILQHGIYYRGSKNFPQNYVNIGNAEIISRRDTIPIACYPDTMVNDYVPFYFAIRTPMLLNIHTGYGGAKKRPQHEIIYLCCNIEQITQSDLQWCFTDGNASNKISVLYNDIAKLADLDWHSIEALDFSGNNANNDLDRKRKKQAEFLVYNHLPVNFIQNIVVHDQKRHDYVAKLVAQYNRNIKVHINPLNKFYF